MEEDKAAGESGTDESANNDDMEEGDSEENYSGGGGGDDDEDEDGGDGGSDSDGEDRELIILCSTSVGRWERYEAQREEGDKTLSSTQGEQPSTCTHSPQDGLCPSTHALPAGHFTAQQHISKWIHFLGTVGAFGIQAASMHTSAALGGPAGQSLVHDVG